MSHAKTLQPALDRLGRGEASEAAALASAVLADGFADLSAIAAFAEKLRQARNPHESLPFFDHVLAKNPEDVAASFGKAKALADTNQKHLSMLEVDRISLMAGRDPDLEVKLVELLVYLRAFQLAEERLDLMIRMRPTLFHLRRHLINMHLQRGKFEWACAALDDALGTCQPSAADLTFAARSYLQAKQPLSASKVARKLVELTPQPASAERLLLAQAYLEDNNAAKAEQEVERLVGVLDKPQDLLHAANIYLATRNKARCEELANRFIAAYDGKPIPLISRIQLAGTLYKIGDDTRAHALLETIPIDTTNDRHVVRLLHNTAYELGYYHLAERAAHQGLSLIPYDPQYMARVSELRIIGQGAPATKAEVKTGFFARFRRG